VPLVISQHQPFYGDLLNAVVTFMPGSGQSLQISISLPVTQRDSAEAHKHVVFKATYLYGDTMPTAFLAMPPVNQSHSSSPPILALREYPFSIIK
jgi:hypothetical protein